MCPVLLFTERAVNPFFLKVFKQSLKVVTLQQWLEVCKKLDSHWKIYGPLARFFCMERMRRIVLMHLRLWASVISVCVFRSELLLQSLKLVICRSWISRPQGISEKSRKDTRSSVEVMESLHRSMSNFDGHLENLSQNSVLLTVPFGLLSSLWFLQLIIKAVHYNFLSSAVCFQESRQMKKNDYLMPSSASIVYLTFHYEQIS